MATLSLFDKLVKERETISQIGGDRSIITPIMVDQFLEQAFLISWILDKTVDQPREQGRRSSETCAGCYQ